ncbi:MAG: hypothetical protein WC539_07520 [Nitrospirota bacterium]
MISSNRLDPGAAGSISTNVDTTGRIGSLVKYISVYSNDRSNPVVTLTVQMYIVKR